MYCEGLEDLRRFEWVWSGYGVGMEWVWSGYGVGIE